MYYYPLMFSDFSTKIIMYHYHLLAKDTNNVLLLLLSIEITMYHYPLLAKEISKATSYTFQGNCTITTYFLRGLTMPSRNIF